jgi:hypothetical protein
MLRFLKLDPHGGREVDYIDLASVVYVRETNPAPNKQERGVEVEIHCAGGVTAKLTGAAAQEFLGQFETYIARLHFRTPTHSGPGHSALSP